MILVYVALGILAMAVAFIAGVLATATVAVAVFQHRQLISISTVREQLYMSFIDELSTLREANFVADLDDPTWERTAADIEALREVAPPLVQAARTLDCTLQKIMLTGHVSNDEDLHGLLQTTIQALAPLKGASTTIDAKSRLQLERVREAWLAAGRPAYDGDSATRIDKMVDFMRERLDDDDRASPLAVVLSSFR